MKKQSAIISIVLVLSMLLVLLTSCNEVSVKNTYLNDANHIIVEYTDGTFQDLGEFKAKQNDSDESTKSEVSTEPAVSIHKVEVNDEKHLILTYSDGTTEDLGYVGVEVEPPLYTVKFVDKDGNLLSEQEIYRGRAAKAPEAPTIADYSFTGWDTEFDNVQSDLTVKAVYKAAESYTVTFKDADGTVLKTETVISGHSATAPTAPTKADKVFSKWDKDYSNIQSDLTVTAVYRDKGSYTVTFKDYNGVVLGTASAKEGEAASAPATPTREGYKFKGWSSAITSVKSDMTVTAQYTFSGGTNVMDISTKVDGKTLTVTLTMKGTVKFCGVEGTVVVPSGLTFVSATDGDGTVSNYKDGTIYYLFSSSSGLNVTKETVITTLKFAIGSSAPATIKLTTTISDIYDQNYAAVSKSVVGQSIKIK